MYCPVHYYSTVLPGPAKTVISLAYAQGSTFLEDSTELEIFSRDSLQWLCELAVGQEQK